MKDIVKFEQGIGGDGATIKGALGVEGESLVAQVQVAYPIAKIVEPATSALDSSLDKLKKTIPGEWDDALIDRFKVEYKKELIKILGETPQVPATPDGDEV